MRIDGVATFYFSPAQLRAAMCHVNESGKTRPGRDHKGKTRTPRNGPILPIFHMDLVATDADSASNNTTDTNGGSESPTLGEVLPVANVESTGTIVTNYVEGLSKASTASLQATSSYRCSTSSYNSMWEASS
jgi:hypothetical protein